MWHELQLKLTSTILHHCFS